MGFWKVLDTIQSIGNATNTLQSFAKADALDKVGIGTSVTNQLLEKHQDDIAQFIKRHKKK